MHGSDVSYTANTLLSLYVFQEWGSILYPITVWNSVFCYKKCNCPMAESFPDSDFSHFSHLTQPASPAACLLQNDLAVWKSYLPVLLLSWSHFFSNAAFGLFYCRALSACLQISVVLSCAWHLTMPTFFCALAFFTLQTLYFSLSPQNLVLCGPVTACSRENPQ